MSVDLLRSSRLVTIAAVAGLAVGLGACSETYLDRFDSNTAQAGNAVASNRAIQTIDPWPAASANTAYVASGERGEAAVGRYRKMPLLPPVPGPGATASNGATASTGSAAIQ